MPKPKPRVSSFGACDDLPPPPHADAGIPPHMMAKMGGGGPPTDEPSGTNFGASSTAPSRYGSEPSFTRGGRGGRGRGRGWDEGRGRGRFGGRGSAPYGSGPHYGSEGGGPPRGGGPPNAPPWQGSSGWGGPGPDGPPPSHSHHASSGAHFDQPPHYSQPPSHSHHHQPPPHQHHHQPPQHHQHHPPHSHSAPPPHHSVPPHYANPPHSTSAPTAAPQHGHPPQPAAPPAEELSHFLAFGFPDGGGEVGEMNPPLSLKDFVGPALGSWLTGEGVVVRRLDHVVGSDANALRVMEESAAGVDVRAVAENALRARTRVPSALYLVCTKASDAKALNADGDKVVIGGRGGKVRIRRAPWRMGTPPPPTFTSAPPHHAHQHHSQHHPPSHAPHAAHAPHAHPPAHHHAPSHAQAPPPHGQQQPPHAAPSGGGPPRVHQILPPDDPLNSCHVLVLHPLHPYVTPEVLGQWAEDLIGRVAENNQSVDSRSLRKAFVHGPVGRLLIADKSSAMAVKGSLQSLHSTPVYSECTRCHREVSLFQDVQGASMDPPCCS